MNCPIKTLAGRACHKDACSKHYFQYSHHFVIELILITFFKIASQVYDFNGNNDKRFECMQSGLK